jgi:glycogen operon protein
MLKADGSFKASGRSLVLLSAFHDGAVWTTAEPARERLAMPEADPVPEAPVEDAPLEASTGAEAAAFDPADHGETVEEASDAEAEAMESTAAEPGEQPGSQETEPSETR